MIDATGNKRRQVGEQEGGDKEKKINGRGLLFISSRWMKWNSIATRQDIDYSKWTFY